MVASTFMTMSIDLLYSSPHLTLLALNINEVIHCLHRVLYYVVSTLIARYGKGYNESSGVHPHYLSYDNPHAFLFSYFHSLFRPTFVARMIGT
jgi:hypothetical protein